MTNRKQRLIEFDRFIASDGTEYPLTDGINRFVMSFSGYGMPPIDYITQRGPYQQGETVLDYRIQPRTLQLIYREDACSREEYWNNRAGLLNAIRPNRHIINQVSTGVLRKILPDGSKRDINVFISKGPSFEAGNISQWDEWAFTETLRFIAHDPFFYDPVTNNEEVVLSGINDHLTFEADGVGSEDLIFYDGIDGVGLLFESDLVSDDLIITYEGTWPCFPTIQITGPLNVPVITNEATGEVIKLNYHVPSDAIVTISLACGNKTVIDDDDVSRIGLVDENVSDLATFHIEPAPGAVGGINTINVTGSGATDNTQIIISYNTRYIGI